MNIHTLITRQAELLKVARDRIATGVTVDALREVLRDAMPDITPAELDAVAQQYAEDVAHGRKNPCAVEHFWQWKMRLAGWHEVPTPEGPAITRDDNPFATQFESWEDALMACIDVASEG